MKNKIYVALSTFAKQGKAPLELLEQSGVEYALNSNGKRLTAEQLVELAQGFHGIVAGLEPYTAEVLDKLPELRCISRCGVGIDNIDLKKAEEKNIAIRNTPDVVAQPVAELTVAMAFDLLRKLTWHTIAMRGQKWERKTGNLLKGKKVGVLGLGRIGRRVAEMMVNLEADVCGADLYPDTLWAEKQGVNILPVSELLSSVDILSINLSDKGKEPFVLGAEEMKLMKETSLVINASRGKFIDETALYEALSQNRIAGAALDVFGQEPYQGDLCKLENVVLTPHVATLTVESRIQMEYEAVNNLLNYFKVE